MLITMDEFADDGKLNEYEKNQIARQWNSIAIAHSSMVEAIQNAYGPETPENQYPIEYEEYMESYEGLRRYLNDEIQSDRSEEHTSELQSRFDIVCRLLLEKKKKLMKLCT